jgi:thioredoxin reductase (NADPH)
MNPQLWSAYAIPLAMVLGLHVHRRRRRETKAVAVLQEAVAAGMTEPPSLHPVVDAAICCGARACVNACPEQALGIVNGKAQLVNPSVCIGHGACAAACPVEAIKLVFGTARRGMDIPYVKPTFETNLRGVYIAGELGGMGLVRKAAEQGRQAIESIARKRGAPGELDVVIVGAGPAGLAATLAAMEKQLRFVTLEQEDSLGGTVYHYPRNKIVMLQPIVLPLVGKVKLGEISKEGLLSFWQGIVERVDARISFGQRVEGIAARGEGYVVRATGAEYACRNVLLSIGRRGTPRKLGVPGEELPKVVYRLVDAEQYRNRRVLVVGGGDAAVEAAVALSREPGTAVTLSYRGEAFSRIRKKNREDLAQAQTSCGLQVMLGSAVSRIDAQSVCLEQGGEVTSIGNDAVIVCAGGLLPTSMLRDIGIHVETKYGTE